MKSFNIKPLLTAIVIAACTFVSCKKDKDAPAPSPESIMKGTWEGLYGFDQETPAKYFAIIIEKNGSLQVRANDKNNPQIGTGTWTLHENVFTAVYQYEGQISTYNMAAKLDGGQKKLTGSWGTGDKNADDGVFYMNKQ